MKDMRWMNNGRTGGTMTSMRSVIKSKTFENENQTSYVEIKLFQTDGVGSANDRVGYHYCHVELLRRNTKGLRQSASVSFRDDNYETRAREFFDSIIDLKQAIKIIKSQENEE